jgi:predicted RNA binding protein YcfA (HicA-like mRNA interferase family)
MGQPGHRKGSVVPDWGSKDLKQGTIRGILRQLGIDIGDFKKA